MRYLSRKMWSHASLDGLDKEYVSQIRRSTPKLISSYRELAVAVARILYHNRHQSLFFRGQNREYRDGKARTSILPSIYRGVKARRRSDTPLKHRFERLREAEELLVEEFDTLDLEADDTFRDYGMVKWAILQHYEVCDTPLLDLTASLRAACSFALANADDTGVVYVLGLPHINGSISFYVEEELVNLKLLGICPPCALRPYFQEGYLVGSMPVDPPAGYSTKLDFGRRLIAKFEIPKDGFWDSDFTQIPQDALFPPAHMDEMQQICDGIRLQLSHNP